MATRHMSSVAERLRMIELRTVGRQSRRQAGAALQRSRSWVRRWWQRYQRGGTAAVQPPRPAPAGPLATCAPPVAAAILTYRRDHPQQGARRAWAALRADPALAGAELPSWRTIHRAWVAAGLVAPQRRAGLPPPVTPVPLHEPHAVWQVDHQDGLPVQGVPEPVVLQSIRAPAAALTIGATLWAERRGAHAISEDAILDSLRAAFAEWGRPAAIQTDGGVRFLGQSQRTFPSRFELFCIGMGCPVQQIRPGHPTENGAVERLHRTLDGALLGVPFPDLAAAQHRLDAHRTLLNTAFPSRARGCAGQAPLVAFPHARHSGRPYTPAQETALFDLAAVDRYLAGWVWDRQAAPSTGQISFANKNVRLGPAYKGKTVTLRFDPADRQVVIYALGTAPGRLGPEIRRFHCAAFDAPTIRGHSFLVPDLPRPAGADPHDTPRGSPL